MPPHETPVLIVGAGPAGLSTSVVLARYGIRALLVERQPRPFPHPRATVISTRTMEHLRSWGLEEATLAGGVDVTWSMRVCETLARVDDGSDVEVGLPTPAQAAVVSPTAPACVPQDHLEGVLVEHLASVGASVELQTELVDLAVDPAGAHAVLRSGRTTRTVRARYLVAADGAHSTVRRAVGIEMHGSTDVLEGIQALFRAPLWATLREHRYGLYWTELPDAEGLFLPAGAGDRWLYGRFWDPTESAVPSASAFADRIRLSSGVPGMPVEIDHVGPFSSAAQLARRFRHGPVFLIGDAAHRVTPRGGTGMNVAAQDGADLGWKLAWVINGWAGEDLLESYERERRPVAEHNVARSADPAGTRRAAEDELRVDLGGRIAHHWVGDASRRTSTLDVLGPGLTLLTGPDDRAWREAADAVSGGPPVATAAFDTITARSLGVVGDAALLVRPDGVPVALLPAVANRRQHLRHAIDAMGSTFGRGIERAAA
jgi:2-polyprenyl-6-methoxyphenol hydroxylase-like FAD-dependent oxidoreductase